MPSSCGLQTCTRPRSGRSLKAIGRAGAGVNNIPVAAMTERGIPVFNAPGANANAVKELVIAGLIMASRSIGPGWSLRGAWTAIDADLHKAVEAGKKAFAGTELPGRTLAVIGLGAIGGRVANAAVALGMQVVGFDPGLTLDAAWQLSPRDSRAFARRSVANGGLCHAPRAVGACDAQLIDADRLKAMKPRSAVREFRARGHRG